MPSVSGNNLVSRLATMEEQIRSRSSLQPIIEKYGLYKNDANKVPMEELVDRMNDAILIKPVAFSNQINSDSNGSNQVPGFQISFIADTPQLAQAVCTEITSKFIDANIHLETSRAEGTADFIAIQLQEAKQKLDEQDAKLAAFQRQFFGSLPDQEQSTVQLLGTLSGQLNSLAQSISGSGHSRLTPSRCLPSRCKRGRWPNREGITRKHFRISLTLPSSAWRLCATSSRTVIPMLSRRNRTWMRLKKRLEQQQVVDKKKPK